MKIAVVGSRSFNDFELLEKIILENFELKDIEYIVSGGAKGADTMAERFAEKYKIKTIVFIPEWNRYSRGAGFIRNEKIVDNSDFVVVLWNGKSKGTLSSINLARKKLGEDKIIINYFKE